MATYNTSDFRPGIKILIDGDPYVMIERNFVKPGKGQALYKCRVRNLLRGTVLDRTWKSGDSVEAADVSEFEGQYLYRQAAGYVFMDNESFEQFELSAEQIGEPAKYLKEGTNCQIVLWDGNPITCTPPNHMVLEVTYCEPGAKGNTATNVTKPVKLETGAEINAPAFINMGDMIKVDTRTDAYIERVNK